MFAFIILAAVDALVVAFAAKYGSDDGSGATAS